MITFNKGERYIKNRTSQSIVDIKFDDGTSIFVFKGALSPNDILVKYTQGKSRIRTPKHIHWVVDLLIKREHDKALVNKFLQVISNRWKEITPLKSRDYNSIVNNLTLSNECSEINDFNSLNQYGYYKMEFLAVLMELLILQEKTNRSDAYMFIKVVEALRSSNDLFSIISTATHR